ncbi:sugar phosphate nucleotidyltransferase, partial [Caulobacter sp. 17J65-9]|uniref:mannose-1-phosphate guanylyltransferase n=1 Tax=Caulobacter sp. 17J65-9 TaxID=2709382 RepID=UPI0013CBCAB9
LEPVGRNTAAAAAVAAALVGAADPDALVLLAPADHVVADPESFWRAVEAGAEAAAERIVTFGIRPSAPETGYGYIRFAEPLSEGVFAVDRFFEKPDRPTAEAYLAAGDYVWNAGIFLFSPAVLLAELARWRPDVLAQAAEALDRARRDGADVWLDPEAFALCPDVSLDYAVMERTARAAVVPCEVGWADVGSWGELWRHGERDGDGNRVRGEAVLLEASDCLVWSDGVPIAVLGAENLVVVATADGVLVAPRERSQDVKRGLEQLRRLRAAAP